VQLLRGITGIEGRKDPLPPRRSDLKAFRSHCHQVAREVGAKVLHIQEPFEGGRVCNYAMACLGFSDSTVAVLLNAAHPLVAFAKVPADGQVTFEYVDCPKLAVAFREQGEYTVASSEELNQPLLSDMCGDHTPTELRRVRYFRPARVGDVIFNFWD
jgi:hypothetical protein